MMKSSANRHEVHLVGAAFLRCVVVFPQQRFEAIQREIRRNGGEWATLRCPLLRRVEDVFVHVPGLQPFVQHGFVHRDVGQEPRMADPVERAHTLIPHSRTHPLMEVTEIEVTDPTHPLFGRRFPLRSVSAPAHGAGHVFVAYRGHMTLRLPLRSH